MDQNPQNRILSILLSLQHELRKVNNLTDFGFFVTNESHALIPYKMAIFWQRHAGFIRIKSISGVAEVDQNSPLSLWLKDIIYQCILKKIDSSKTLNKTDFIEPIQDKWSEATGEQVLWSPLHNPNGKVEAGFFFIRNESWTENDLKRYFWLQQAYEYSWQHLYHPARWRLWLEHYYHEKRRPITIGVIAAAIIIPLLPVSDSVLAPASIISNNPMIITSPLQGVIKRVYVKSNQNVKQGQLLFSLDKTILKNETELSAQNLKVADAQLQESIQKGFANPNSRSSIGILKAKVGEGQLQLAYSSAMLSKAKVSSPENGIVLYDEAHDWTGQPVQVGEKIMTVTQADQVEIEVWVPAAEALQFKVGSAVKLYPNGQPFTVIHGVINYSSYSAEISPDKILSYRLVANVNPKDISAAQLGLQGTAKVYGNTVCLIYYVLRTPMATLRRLLG